MKKALIVAAFVALATPAAAEPFDAFKTLCLDVDSDQAATERVAKSMNWYPAPAEMVAELGSEAIGFVSHDPELPETASSQFVMASRALITDPVGRRVDVFVCAVGGQGDFSDTESQVSFLLGAGGVDDAGNVRWIYTLTDGVPKSAVDLALQGEDAIAEFAKREPVYLVSLSDEGNGRLGLVLGLTRNPDL